MDRAGGVNISKLQMETQTSVFAPRAFAHLHNRSLIGSMDINTVRILNLRRLVHQAGSIKAFADKVGTDPSYVSALLSEKIRRNPGDKFMRRVEKAYELDTGSLDFPEETSIAAAMALTVLPDNQREHALAHIEYLIVQAGPKVANQPAAASYLKMRHEPKHSRADQGPKKRKPAS